MNDEFLHQLRTPPPPAFAVRLKSKLDAQDHLSRVHRLLKLCVVLLLLGGGTALALVSTSARNIVVTVVEHLSSTQSSTNKTESSSARTDNPYAATRVQRGNADQRTAAVIQKADSAGSGFAADSLVAGGNVQSQHSSGDVVILSSPKITSPDVLMQVVNIAMPAALTKLVEGLASAYRDAGAGTYRVNLHATEHEDFTALCNREADVLFARLPIQKRDAAACAARGVSFVELPIGADAQVIIVHPDNHWATSLTAADLRELWSRGDPGRGHFWSQLRPTWPTLQVEAFSPRLASTERDAFAYRIFGAPLVREGESVLADDASVAARVSGTREAIGYVDYRYYAKHAAELTAVAIVNDASGDAVLPTADSIVDGRYQPLSGRTFIYVNVTEAWRPALVRFVALSMRNQGRTLIADSMLPLSPGDYEKALRTFRDRVVGLTRNESH